MESQLPNTNDEQEIVTGQHTGHHDDHNEDEHHGEEKKSRFMRFKDKARKLKNTITKYGQDQDHHDDDNDDDDDEDETVEDPEEHGAPNAKVAQPKDNLERPSVIAEDRYTKPVASHDPPLTVPAGAYGTNLSEQSELGDQEVDPEKWKSKIENPTGMEEEVPFAPSPTRVPTPVTEHTSGTKHAFDPFKNRGQDETHGGLKSSTGKSTGMVEVPHAPSGLGSGTDPANHETKVTNPTHPGGKEAGLSQVQHSFDKMGIHDSASERKRFDPEHPDNLQRATLAGNQSTQSSKDTEKISSIATPLSGLGLGSGSGSDPANYETKVNNPTHTGGKEAGLSQAQHSFDKMGIHDSGSERPEHPENLPRENLAGNHSTQGSNYTENISSIATPLSGLGLGSGSDPANEETKVTNPTHTGGKEAGLSQVQHSFDKMDIHDSGSERPEHPENLPHDTLAGNQSTQSNDDTEKISSIATPLSGLGLGSGSGSDPANYENKVTNPTHTGGKEAGLSQVEHSFDKMGIHNSGSERPEHPENLPHDTLAGNQSTALSGLGSGLGLGSDPANYETKVTNPTHTGGKEAGLSQVQHSFDKMGIHDSGSERPEHPENLPLDILAGNQSTQGGNYTEKISSIAAPLSGLGLGSGTDPANYETEVTNPTHTGGKEAGLSQAQHSFDKMGIHDSGSERPEQPENLPRDTLAGNQSTQGSNYTEKISSIATPLSGLGSGSDPANDETKVTNPTRTGGKEAGLSQVQHSFDKMGIHDSASERKRFDPEHPDNLQRAALAGNQSTQSSSYTEMISSIASTISEKAGVAKDVIASKLGYGEHPTTPESHENVKNSGSTATDYAHSLTDKVTETSAPVYEKVLDDGSSVMSKVQGTISGTGSGRGAGIGHQQMHGTETMKGTDKGVSVKEGDEDKANAIHRGNQEESEKNSGEDRPMGGVTEKVEVRSRLGTDGNEGQQQQSSNASVNKNGGVE